MQRKILGGSLVNLLLLGCPAPQGPASDAPTPLSELRDEPAPTPPAGSPVDTCAASATLYPRSRMADTSTRDAVVGKQWARREGGPGSMHGPPTLSRRTTDLRLDEREGVIRLTYDQVIESTGEPAQRTHIAQDCQICGAVLVCDQSVWALSTRTTDPPNGAPLHILDTDAALELDDHDLYLIRHGHEVHLDFADDPRTTARGALEIRLRKLERGAPVAAHSTTFTSEQVATGYDGRRVRVDLPGADAIRIELLPGRSPDAGGYGVNKTLEANLYELESLKRNPQLMQQPESLEIAADAPGFNLPRR